MERSIETTKNYTSNGLPIVSFEEIQRQRERFAKKKSKDYIAQPGGQEDSLKVDADIVITGGNRGGGKANTYFTDVIVPTGTVKMGDLKVGDPVCTPYEGTQVVEAIFEQGKQMPYRLYFDDGTSCAVLKEHRFTARLSSESPWEVMTVEDIKQRYRIGQEYPNGLAKNIRTYVELPLCGEVQFVEHRDIFDLPWHPYVFGVITASGNCRVTTAGADVHGFNPFVRDRCEKLGFQWHHSYRTGRNFITGYTNEQLEYAKRGKMTRKGIPRIPQEYMTASINARWEFLRGALDIMATTWRHTICLTGRNKYYLEDLAWIARSLGIWCRVERTRNTNEFCLWLIAPNDDDMFDAENRKTWGNFHAEKATCLGPNILTKRIIQIKRFDGPTPCRCIQVSGKDHLYLTDAFTVNHNTVMLLMNPMYNVNNPAFNGLILRKEKGDLDNIIRESAQLYGWKGEYKSSYMRWDFHSSAQILFSYFTGTLQDFKDRMQGRQYAYIGVDEITQLEWEKFKYLITNNRNGAHIRNRFLGTCNPDPTSWVRKLIDWWIGDDGYPIPERNGVVRYCFMGGETPEEITWGSTRLEVYEKAKVKIDELVSENDAMPPEYMYVKSVVFVRAELDDNRALLDSSPEYKANLAQQSDEQRERDFKGNWNFMAAGDDLIKMIHLHRCFENPQMLGDKVRRASCDIALTGGDACVMWLWIGWHIQDVFVCRFDSDTLQRAIHAKLDEWRVAEENFVYDLQGVGQYIKGFFPKAKPFSNQEAVDEKFKGLYDTKKSQCMKTFADKIVRGEISFEPSILTRRFSGKNYKNKELKEILMEERKVFRQDMKKEDRGWCNVNKDTMKNIIGRSPDFAESLMMRMLFDVRKAGVATPTWVSKMAGRRGMHVHRLS